MYQTWQWGTPASASPTSGIQLQPTATTQVAATQWPAGYSQYAVTPEVQQQWAAAWATAQYAYGGNVPVGDAQTTAFAGAYPDYQTANTAASANEAKKAEDSNSVAEKPKNPAEQPIAQELPESDKIKQLKEQAEKWSHQQPAATSWSYSATNTTSSNSTTVTAPNDSLKTLASTNASQSSLTQSQMTKEEEEFERQFKDWEKQFDAWKQQNQNHPDKEAFARYEKQWQEWRSQLLQRKEQLQKAKAEQLANAGAQGGMVNTQANSTTIADSAATPTTAMYYQHPQYMYMQQYVYPGTTTVAPTAVPTAVVPQTVVPSAVVPSSMVPPAGVPPVSVPPAVLSAVPQQMPYNVPPGGADNYGNQPLMGMSGPSHDNMNYDIRGEEYENDRDMYGYRPGPGPGPMRGRNGPRDDGMGPNYEGFDGSNMSEEGDYQRDNWAFGRGRGRGSRGRARGRGRDRWAEPPTEMDARPPGPPPGGVRTPRKTLLPGGPGTAFPEGPGAFPEEDGPPPFEYPTEDCRDEFSKDDRQFSDDRPNRRHDDRFMYDGPQYPHNDSFQSQPFDEHFPPDPNQYPPDQEFPDRFPPDRKRFPPDERFPDKDRFPDQERFPPGPGTGPGPGPGPGPGREGFHPGKDRFPRGQDRYPPDDVYPPEEERYPRDDRFPPEQEMFPPDQERFPPPPKGGRFPPDDNRFPPPPEENRFPHNEEGFPPERFPPPRRMMDEGGFGDREFDEFPPEDEMYGPGGPGHGPGPGPFRDDYPPFEERGGRGRGRFAGRGRRGGFRGDFDRFGGPPFPPRMRNDQFGPPEFQPPDDRFGFPGDGPPPRMPPGGGRGGMRPPFEPPGPPYGGPGPRGRFPEEPPFFGDGPGRYKSIDYTHRPAAAVMGDDFNPHYEHESEFQDDVNAYRARPGKRKIKDSVKKSPVEKKRDKTDMDMHKDDKDNDEEKQNIKDEDKDD